MNIFFGELVQSYFSPRITRVVNQVFYKNIFYSGSQRTKFEEATFRDKPSKRHLKLPTELPIMDPRLRYHIPRIYTPIKLNDAMNLAYP